MAATLQTIISDVLFLTKTLKFHKTTLYMFPWLWLTIHHYLNQWYHSLLTHIWVNWRKWIRNVNQIWNQNKNMHIVMMIFTFNPKYTAFVTIATANDCLIRFSNIMESLIGVLCLKLSVKHRRWEFKMNYSTALKDYFRGWMFKIKPSEFN